MSSSATDSAAAVEVKCELPTPETLVGKHVSLVPTRPEHIAALYASMGGAENETLYEFMSDGPFLDAEEFEKGVQEVIDTPDILLFNVQDPTTKQLRGILLFSNVVPKNGVLEFGLVFGISLQRTVGATEAVYLALKKAFDGEGYRRVEWRCNNLHVRSKRAAVRYGFTPEALFRQHRIVKGKNRDTAVFSMLDKEWPGRKAAFEQWLDDVNFDADGRQRRDLSSFRKEMSP